MTESTAKKNNAFGALIQDIRQIISNGRARAYASLNAVMTDTYWKIGRRIVEEEQHGSRRAEYGRGLLKELAACLSAEFGNNFNDRNLRHYRQFYLYFPQFEIWNARVPNLLTERR